MTTALALAFGAGMVATVNPCGFAMLPAYLSYFMGIQEGSPSRPAVLRSALVVGGTVSSGFLLVFGIAGVVISGVSSRLAGDWIPWLALAIGLGLVVLGVAMLAGFELRVDLPRAGRASTVRSYRNVLAFGVSYAVASLSCTLPVFLTLIATQFSTRSVAAGLVIFAVYAAGMATVLLALTVVLALGKQSLVSRLRAAGARVNRISGVLLVAAGAWISWFWITALASGAPALGGSPSFRFIENISQRVINFVAANTAEVGFVLGALVAAALFVVMRGDRMEPPAQPDSDADEAAPVAAGV